MSQKTFTLKELASANGLSVDTIARRIKAREIKIKFAREVRFKKPIQYDTEKARPALEAAGYKCPCG
jgi:hypothetical protein